MHKLAQGLLVVIWAAAPRLGWARPADDGGAASTASKSDGGAPASPIRDYGTQPGSPIREYGTCHQSAELSHHQELRELEKAEAAAVKALHASPGWRTASGADRESQTKALKASFKARRESLQGSFRAAQKACREKHPLPPQRVPPTTGG